MHSALTKGCSPNSTYSISEIDRIIDEFPACPKRSLDTGCYRKREIMHLLSALGTLFIGIAAHEMKENATRLEKYIMTRKCCSVEHNGEHELLGKEELPYKMLPEDNKCIQVPCGLTSRLRSAEVLCFCSRRSSGYDTAGKLPFLSRNHLFFQLFNSLLCASVDDNLKEDAGAVVNITRRTAAFLSTHLPMKLVSLSIITVKTVRELSENKRNRGFSLFYSNKWLQGQSESVEESVARAIALKHSYVPFLFRDLRRFNDLVTPAAVLQMLKEISKNLENIGSEK